MLQRFGRAFLLLILSATLMFGTVVSAQDKTGGNSGQGTEVDPLKRPISEKQRQEQEKALKKELGKTYKKWLDEDVRWIISDEEKEAFKKLSNDEERDNFIEQFWVRRDPTPDTVENEFKEEHYRRITYANEHFAAGIPGWKTDRGRMYIMYGPPDQIESHPSGGIYNRPMEEGGGQTSTYPFETWRYRYIEAIQEQEVIIEFVDTCMCNDYHMTMDRSEKDALLHVPGAGDTLYESMGMRSRADRFSNGGMERLGEGPMGNNSQMKQFDRLELFAKLNRAPAVKFKDLEEIVSHKITVNLMPFDVRFDFVKVTSDTVLVPVTLQMKNRDITFVTKEGVARGTVNIFGRVTTLTGRVAQTFEDIVQVDSPAELLQAATERSSLYWKALPLKPGMYRLDLVLKDVNGDRMGTWSKGIRVPEFAEDKLASSSLIVADQMEKVASKAVNTGNFVIGATKVRPRVESADGKPAVFKRGQKANFWMQVYGLSMDEQTKRPSANIEYDIMNLGSKKQVVHMVENTAQLGNVGEQITLEKSLPLASLEPGIYQITIKVNDNVSKQVITPTAKFAVE
ncbi:MAG TPA: GWxTD domain-containing protein [Terriglobales bacterium]|nr:GWxTD domain-containing protein [Terriglobales bacterium]